MLPKHALPQLIINRASSTLNRLELGIWKRSEALQVEASMPQQKQVSLAEAKLLKLEPVAPNSSWGRLFDQRWCRVRLSKPTDENSWFFWMDQGEATLYVDDVPYFGLNIAHRRCRLPAGVTELWIQSSCIQSCIWQQAATPMVEGSLFEEAYLAARDDTYWHAYHDLKCLFDLAMDQRSRENPQTPKTLRSAGLQPLVDHYTPQFRILLRVMDDAVDALDMSGVAAFRESLSQGYARLKTDKAFATCILTGHAHVDLVWIWPERMGELKAVNVFATANHLLKEYPEFRFAYSQPASYEAVERREPSLYAAVKEQISKGQWQATGAMQVESDTILACGEALARSFLVGQDGFRRINGKPSKLTWLPDVFGYSACLPQIMQQTGVTYFFTTKMTWNSINRFPYSSFRWKGNDGSEVLAHVTQASGYVTQMKMDQVLAPMHANQQADLHAEYLLPVGFGDGGGGVTDEMLERARRFDHLPSLPELKWDHPEAFFDRLNVAVEKLPIYQGECYLEYHRGTYTTHSNLKASFRNLERALQVAEAVSVATGKTWDQLAAWKRLIFAQFHDFIPGSSVWDVYIEGIPELDQTAKEQCNLALQALTGKGEACLFNPHTMPVECWHQVEGEVPVRVHLPALSGTPLAAAMVESPAAPVLQDRTISNGLTSLTLDSNGWIESLIWDGVAVPQSGPMGQLMLYVDRAAHYEAWDIDRQTLSLGAVCNETAVITPYQSECAVGFEVSRKIGQNSHASVKFELQAGSPEVHISIQLDWQEAEHLLKLYFPTEYSAKDTRCGIPFGSVLRPQLPGDMVAEAMWEIPFSRYLAVFDDGEQNGISFFTESKYGASVRSGAVGISLVRSPKVTGFDAQLAEAWPSHLSQYRDEPHCSDLGTHTLHLAIAPYSISLPRERQPAALADTLFTAPVAYTGAAIPALIESIEGGETLIPAWAKPTKDGWVLRLHEVAGQRGNVRVRVKEGQQLWLTNLSESDPKPLEQDQSIPFTPYAVVSLLVR